MGTTYTEGLLQKAALWPCGQWPYGFVALGIFTSTMQNRQFYN